MSGVRTPYRQLPRPATKDDRALQTSTEGLHASPDGRCPASGPAYETVAHGASQASSFQTTIFFMIDVRGENAGERDRTSGRSARAILGVIAVLAWLLVGVVSTSLADQNSFRNCEINLDSCTSAELALPSAVLVPCANLFCERIAPHSNPEAHILSQDIIAPRGAPPVNGRSHLPSKGVTLSNARIRGPPTSG